MNTCDHQYEVSSPIDTVEVCVKCGHRIGCEPQIPDRPKHTHAWETVQRCFECDEIREYQPEETPVASMSCPPDPIFTARKQAGWKRTDWTK